MRKLPFPIPDDPRWLVACLTALLVTLALWGATDWLVALSGLVSIAVLWAALVARHYARLAAQDSQLVSLSLAIARDSEALGLFRAFCVALRDVSANLDPIYRELALDRLERLSREATAVARGRFEFEGTEAWRQIYEKLLRSRGLYRYRSVAHVHTPAYWQDEPGRRSMRVNYETLQAGLAIERIAIVADGLWPPSERLPVDPIADWLDEQARHGITLSVVRASRLEGDLLADLGLYGHRAVGRQTVDERGRTVRFTLSFDFAELLAAESRWDRLQIYATPYEKLLDRSGTCTYD